MGYSIHINRNINNNKNRKNKKNMIETRTNHEIDILALTFNTLKDWTSLLVFFIVFTLVGVIYALSKPKIFQSNVVLAPETANNLGINSSGLSDIASSFGINLDKNPSPDAIYPEIYPEVFASTDFQKELFNIPVRESKNGNTITYQNHLIITNKINEPQNKLLSWIKGKFTKKENITFIDKHSKNDPFIISKKDDLLCTIVGISISCKIDKKTGIIGISVQDKDPLVAAIVADTVQHRLQEYITNYRTKKARNDYNYYNNLAIKAKQRYELAREVYNGYADANSDPVLASFQSKQDELENEMQLRYNTYTNLTTQLQAAQAKVLERTPAFTMIQRPIMPYKPIGTPRYVYILAFLFLGFCLDIVWVNFIKSHIWRRGRVKTK